MKIKFNKKTALIVSVCLPVVWSIMGTTTTLAWFTDTTDVARNTFRIGHLELAVSYKNQTMDDYAPVESDSAVFDDKALYEPNYTQVVHLKVENVGDMAFDYQLMVDAFDYTDSISVNGNVIHLPRYLKFGVIFGDTEAQLEREAAQMVADLEMGEVEDTVKALGDFSQKDTVTVEPGKTRYVAIVIYMPKSVGNEANHMKNQVPPEIKLGLTVYAQQAGTPME
jgi:predicted ribosomally synthesized peptide with SipW-like signal peptide